MRKIAAENLFASIGLLLALGSLETAVGLEAKPLRPGDKYRISTIERMRGFLDLPDKPGGAVQRLQMKGERATKYVELVLDPTAAGNVTFSDRVLRVYEKLDSTRTVGGQVQVGYPLRQAVRQIVLHRAESIAKPYSPIGPLKVEEVQALTYQVFAPALNGLLPRGELQNGARWAASRAAAAHLAGLIPLESGGLKCTYEGLIDFRGRKLAQVVFVGTLVGISEEGRAKDDLIGSLYIDPVSGVLHSVNIEVERLILDKNDRTTGKLEIKFELALHPIGDDPRLGPDVVAKIPLEPGLEATAILYEYPPFAFKLLHPRAWLLANVTGLELEFEQRHNKIVIQLYPDDALPNVAEYARQIKKLLVKDGFTLVEQTMPPLEKVQGAATRGDPEYARFGRFEWKTTYENVAFRLQYYLFQQGKRGVAVRCVFKEDDLAVLNIGGDAAWIVRNFTFTQPTMPNPEKEPAQKAP